MLGKRYLYPMRKIFILPFLLMPTVVSAQTQNDSTDYWKGEFTNAMEVFDVDKAIAAGEKWVEKDTASHYPTYNLARAYMQKSDYERAEELLTEILDSDSTNVPALNQLGRICRKSNRYRDALAVYEQLLNADTTRSYYPRVAAEMSYLTMQFDRAFDYYHQSLSIDKKDPNSLAGLAKISMDAAAFHQADSLLSLGLKNDSSNFTIRLLYAKSAYLQENYAEVDDLLDPENLMANNSTQGLRYLGIALYHLGDYMRSMSVLTRLVNLDIESHYPHYYIGLCYLALGEMEYAEVQFSQAVNKSLSPNLPIYYEQLGLAQQELGNHRMAIENLAMAKKLSADPELNYHLGISYDAYYQDKDVALQSFKTYLREIHESDSLAETDRTRHAESRIKEINRQKHFEGKMN